MALNDTAAVGSSEANRTEGLGDKPKDEWPDFTQAQSQERAIDLMKPGSSQHKRVLDYLLKRLDKSQHEMENFYSRWNYNEQRLQAYVHLPDYEQMLKKMSDEGKPPQPYNFIIPYSYATISTIVTYLVHTFTGRKPMFQVAAMKQESVEAAHKMEQVLQYQADHTRLIRVLFQYFQDASTYGLGVMKVNWNRERKLRTVWEEAPRTVNLLGTQVPLPGTNEKRKSRQMRTVYEGNEVESIDPFMFFPDPSVPMTEVSKRGEFVFWRKFEGKHKLKRMEADGDIKWVDNVGELNDRRGHDQSVRDLISRGKAHPGSNDGETGHGPNNYTRLDQGTVEIIPAELGFGESQVPEKWIFTIANRQQIIQAEPFDTDHDMHPVAVTEPWGMGHGFGEAGVADYLGSIQDISSWFINSHVENVRSSINNMFVVDPSMIEMQDLLNPPEGRDGLILRLKRAAHGQDVRSAIEQLNVQDVTRGHVSDLQTFMQMGDSLSAVNENIRGLQNSGGRKTATEVRTSSEAAASRLASLARRISAEGIVDMTQMMSLNTQQFLTEDFYLQIVGLEGKDTPIQISPEHVVGDFYFPVHDGTLPLDRVAMLDIWRQLFQIVTQDQQLRQDFDVDRMFEWIAELGGAKNLEDFKASPETAQRQSQFAQQQANVRPDAEAAEQAQAEGAQSVGPSSSAQVNSNPERAADRQLDAQAILGGLGQ